MPKNKKAFLVEDDANIRESLQEALLALSGVVVVDCVDNETDAINWLAVYPNV